MRSWHELLGSELYQWFSLVERGRAQRAGRTVVRLAPQAVPQAIMIEVALDARLRIVGASLQITRAWLHANRVRLANGGDLVASLVTWLAHDDPLLTCLASQLRDATMRSAPAIVGPGYAPPPAAPSFAPACDLLLVPPSSASRETLIQGVRPLELRDLRQPDGDRLGLEWGERARRGRP